MDKINEVLDFYRGKRVLVTGHTGFKGGWLSYWLTELGAEVCGYSVGLVSEPSFYEVMGVGERVRDEFGDVRDYGKLVGVMGDFRPEVVFHLAGQSILLEGVRDPRRTFEVNVMGTVNVLEGVREVDSVEAVMLVTSDKCYENREWGWGYREVDTLGGKDPYSGSKACAEWVIDAYRRTYFNEMGVGVSSGRAGNVLGGGDWGVGRLVADCMRAWSLGEVVKIRNGLATRPWQHVLEVVYGYMSLGVKLSRNECCGAYNFGPSGVEEWSVGELVEMMGDYWGGGECEVGKPENEKECGYLKLSVERAYRDLGWKTRLGMNEMLEWVVEWYRAYYGGDDVESISREQIALYESLIRGRGIWKQPLKIGS